MNFVLGIVITCLALAFLLRACSPDKGLAAYKLWHRAVFGVGSLSLFVTSSYLTWLELVQRTHPPHAGGIVLVGAAVALAAAVTAVIVTLTAHAASWWHVGSAVLATVASATVVAAAIASYNQAHWAMLVTVVLGICTMVAGGLGYLVYLSPQGEPVRARANR